ncbi:outer membrane protein [Aquipluma nitroreducens]|uniref:Outer membrane protein n=1 Tax=Aquipluma nitroreducens TaxID=2010828 RepID=A0A5K7S3M3_9BACT|nr:RagB/SusD family nutrient uptake outer membrane protein [Aquipluma nitroreducens]BBE16080.1 outer membrane protein [Aquipluma nitroreducens]
MNNHLIHKIAIYFLATILIFSSCKNTLREEVYSSLTTNSYFKSEQDFTLALYGAYKGLAPEWGYYHKYYHCINDSPTDMLLVDQAWAQGEYGVLKDFTWDASTGLFGGFIYDAIYIAISRANLVIDETSKTSVLTDAVKKRIIAESKFIRALCYYDGSGWFGGLPIVTDSAIDPLSKPSRASIEEVNTLIEKDLTEALGDLPVSVPKAEWGRATQGAAQALLCKLYMRTKDFAKAKDMAANVISGPYTLQATYGDVFSLSNEENNEIIFAINNITPNPQGNGSLFNAHALPSDFKPISSLDSWSGFRATMTLYNYFELGDHRRDYLIFDYPTRSGEIGHSVNPIVVKFPIDPTQAGHQGTNDELVLRLADIILCKAEAVNEVSGPTQEAFDLINVIRARAFGNTTHKLSTSDLPTKDAFRSYLLTERARELYHEGKRREDLIRFGKYIQFAKDRGATSADDHQLLFPIPKPSLDANTALVQNPGY